MYSIYNLTTGEVTKHVSDNLEDVLLNTSADESVVPWYVDADACYIDVETGDTVNKAVSPVSVSGNSIINIPENTHIFIRKYDIEEYMDATGILTFGYTFSDSFVVELTHPHYLQTTIEVTIT